MLKIHIITFTAGGPGQNIDVPEEGKLLCLVPHGSQVEAHYLAKSDAKTKTVFIEQAGAGMELLDNNKQEREYLGAVVCPSIGNEPPLVFHVFIRLDGDPLRAG